MLEFSNIKIINHHFRVKNDNGELGIGYDMIIGQEFMVQLGLTDNFNCQVLQWGSDTEHMKEPIDLLGQSRLNKHEMHEVFMHTAETAFTR